VECDPRKKPPYRIIRYGGFVWIKKTTFWASGSEKAYANDKNNLPLLKERSSQLTATG
jgi:hypothetical protein